MTVSEACRIAMLKMSERMDADLANAKNKQGIIQKYLHSIAPRAKPDWAGDPFDFGRELSEDDYANECACVAIQMDMHDRLMKVM